MHMAYRNITVHIILNDHKGSAAEQVEQLNDALRSFNEFRRRNTLFSYGHVLIRLRVRRSTEIPRTVRSVSK